MKEKKFGCYLFGSREQGSQSPKSDVDLLLICNSSEKVNIEFNLRVQLALKFPEWKGLKLDIKHAPIGQIIPEHPVSLLVIAELKAKSATPILGENLLEQTIEIQRDLLLRAQVSILRYWANIFLTVPQEDVFSVIKTQRSLRNFHSFVLSFVTYLALYQNPKIFFIDPEKIPDAQYQKFRKLVKNELNFSLDCLSPQQTLEVKRHVFQMYFFCSKIWSNINRQKVHRIA